MHIQINYLKRVRVPESSQIRAAMWYDIIERYTSKAGEFNLDNLKLKLPHMPRQQRMIIKNWDISQMHLFMHLSSVSYLEHCVPWIKLGLVLSELRETIENASELSAVYGEN